MSQPVVAIDAGNTRIKLGRFDLAHRSPSGLPVALFSTAVHCGDGLPWDSLLTDGAPAMITGSNPQEARRIHDSWPQDRRPPVLLSDVRRLPIVIDVDAPERVGIDRLLTAVAANIVRAPGQPAVLIDSGTATTVDYVNAAGHFCGGAILPGFDLCSRALHQYTALLPLVEMAAIRREADAPAELGRNTQAAITSGLYWGHVGAVKELMRRLMLAGDPHIEPLILLTGGAAPLLYPHLPTIVRHEPLLALQGLAAAAATIAAEDAVTPHS